jgi:hypothetical protein
MTDTGHMLLRDGQPIGYNNGSPWWLQKIARASAENYGEVGIVEAGSIEDDTFTITVVGAGMAGADVTYAIVPRPEGWVDPAVNEDAVNEAQPVAAE